MTTLVRQRRKVTLSLPPELLESLDRWAKATNTSRSAVVERLIVEERQRREYSDLEQAYAELTADGIYDDANDFLAAQAEVALARPG